MDPSDEMPDILADVRPNRERIGRSTSLDPREFYALVSAVGKKYVPCDLFGSAENRKVAADKEIRRRKSLEGSPLYNWTKPVRVRATPIRFGWTARKEIKPQTSVEAKADEVQKVVMKPPPDRIMGKVIGVEDEVVPVKRRKTRPPTTHVKSKDGSK